MARWFDVAKNLASGFSALLLGSMFVCFLLQIVFRYVLNWPVGWTVEYVRIAWLWGILFSYAFVVRDREIIRLDILYEAMPRGIRRWFDIVSHIFCAAVLLYALPATVDYIDFMQRERTGYIRLSFGLLFSIYIPFSIAVSIRCFVVAWKSFRGISVYSNHEDPELEDYT